MQRQKTVKDGAKAQVTFPHAFPPAFPWPLSAAARFFTAQSRVSLLRLAQEMQTKDLKAPEPSNLNKS